MKILRIRVHEHWQVEDGQGRITLVIRSMDETVHAPVAISS